MKRLYLILLAVCLLLPLLCACGSAPEEIVLTPLDPASTPPLTKSEQSVQIRTPFGPAVTATLPPPETKTAPTLGTAERDDPVAQHYVLNTKSMRFHLPGCSSVEDMKPKNREDYTGSRDELLAMGYKPCGRCNP